MLLAIVVMAIREHEDYVSSDKLWNDVGGRFTKIDETPRKGSFGVTWLVKDSRLQGERADDILALKFFYFRTKLLSVTSTKLLKMQDRVLNGKKECEIQQLLTEHGKSNPHKGAQRFISCHETNVPAQDDREWQNDSEDPLWVLMENGGDSSLLQWIRSDQWKADLVQPLFKQLVEGLSFLASMSPPYTHHDLKPDNCVIKQTRDGKLLLNIIDFGGAAKVTPESRFVPPAPTLGSTRGFFPWEYGAKITVSNDCPPFHHQTAQSCKILRRAK